MKRKIALLFLAIVTCTCFCFGLTACSDDLTVIEKAGESTVIETELAPSEIGSAEDVIYAFVGKLRDFSTYQIKATGSTEASIVTQSIETETIKNGNEFYKTHVSDSTFVHTEMVAFFKNNRVVYNANSKSAKDFSVAEKSEFKKTYGVTPDDLGICGYVINKDSVKYAEKAYSQSGVTTYRVVLDGNKAGANVRIQMLEFGGLNDYPSFNSLTMLISIKEDWTPVTITTTATYDVSYPVIGDVTCTETLKYTFSNVNGKVAIPNTQEFNAKIGSTPTEVKTRKNSTFDKLANVLFGNGFTGSIELYTELFHNAPYGSEQNTPLEINVNLFAKYDSEAFNNDEFAKCLQFRLDVCFSDSIKNLANELTSNPMIGKMIPEEVTQYLQLFSLGNTLSIFNTADGTIYIVVANNGVATYILAELPLGDAGFGLLYAIADSGLDMLTESIEQPNVKLSNVIDIVTGMFNSTRESKGNEDLSYVASEYVSFLIDSSYKYGLNKLVELIATTNSQGDEELYASEYAKYNMLISAMIGATVTGADLVIDFDGNTFKQAYIEVFGKPQSLPKTTTLAKLTVGGEMSVDEEVFTAYDQDIAILQQYSEQFIVISAYVQVLANGLPLEEYIAYRDTIVNAVSGIYMAGLDKYVVGIEYFGTFTAPNTFGNDGLIYQYDSYVSAASMLTEFVTYDSATDTLSYPPMLYDTIAEYWELLARPEVFRDYLGADFYDAMDSEFGW